MGRHPAPHLGRCCRATSGEFYPKGRKLVHIIFNFICHWLRAASPRLTRSTCCPRCRHWAKWPGLERCVGRGGVSVSPNRRPCSCLCLPNLCLPSTQQPGQSFRSRSQASSFFCSNAAPAPPVSSEKANELHARTNKALHIGPASQSLPLAPSAATRTFSCSMSTPAVLLPQGLCTNCLLCLEWSLPTIPQLARGTAQSLTSFRS